jgi:hypothetical protein
MQSANAGAYTFFFFYWWIIVDCHCRVTSSAATAELMAYIAALV